MADKTIIPKADSIRRRGSPVCVVIDKEEKRVIYYAQEIPTFASHPKDNADVSKLLHKLLKDFIR